MRIDKLEELGFKHDATVKSTQSEGDDFRGVIDTSIYHIPNKRLILIVSYSDIYYYQSGNPANQYFSIRLIFAVPVTSDKHILWGSLDHYSIPEDERDKFIEMTADNLVHCGGASSGASDDRNTYIFNYQYGFKNQHTTANDVVDAVKILHNKIEAYLADGVFNDLQVTSFAPTYTFKNCEQHFWHEVYKQFDFKTIVKKPWG